jgi:hypothetical protein
VLVIRTINCINTTSGVCHFDRLVCSSGRNVRTCIVDRHLHRVTHTRCCIVNIDLTDDEQKTLIFMVSVYLIFQISRFSLPLILVYSKAKVKRTESRAFRSAQPATYSHVSHFVNSAYFTTRFNKNSEGVVS